MSAFDMWGLDQRLPSAVLRPMEDGPLEAAFKAQAARAAGFQLTAHVPSALWAIKEVKARSRLPRTTSAVAPFLCPPMGVPAGRHFTERQTFSEIRDAIALSVADGILDSSLDTFFYKYVCTQSVCGYQSIHSCHPPVCRHCRHRER